MEDVGTLAKQELQRVEEVRDEDGRAGELSMVSAINAGGLGGSGFTGGGTGFTKGIMEHKVINNLTCVSPDKSLLRQWHRSFVTALGQYDQVHEEIVQHLVKETDFGKDMDKVVEDLKAIYGGAFARVSGDVWDVLLDTAENEALRQDQNGSQRRWNLCIWSSVSLVRRRVGPGPG